MENPISVESIIKEHGVNGFTPASTLNGGIQRIKVNGNVSTHEITDDLQSPSTDTTMEHKTEEPKAHQEQNSDNPSFVLVEPNHVKYEDRPIPSLSSPHDVIINVKHTGICGSDVHYWAHGKLGSFIVKEPMVLGHESSGIVHSVGTSVTNLKVGDKVAMEPGITCRRCTRCKEGLYNLCPETKFAATPPYDGTLARYYVLPADFCYKLPPHVSLLEGALVEPLSVATHVVRQADVKPGNKVVVFGAGPVGLLCLAVSKAFGASNIVSVDVNQDRLAFAKKYAAHSTFFPAKGESPTDGAVRMAEECDLGEGADVVIDASGAEPCIQQGLAVLRRGGSYAQAGMGKTEVAWPIFTMIDKELTVRGSFRYKQGDYETSIRLLASGKISVKELITNQVPFDQAEQAFKDTKEAKGIKIIIDGPLS